MIRAAVVPPATQGFASAWLIEFEMKFDAKLVILIN